MADKIIQMRGVTKEFGTSVVTRVLHGIDLDIEKGEVAALMGPSGSGKSTLLNLIGLLEKPSAGIFHFLEQDIFKLVDPELTYFRGMHVGFVFQFHYLLPAFSALENVMMPLIAARGRYESEMELTAKSLLIDLGLGDKFESLPGELSGGQQQRVAIARALVRSPSLILADEPTGNLDTKSADHAFTALTEMCREKNLTLLVVTHDLQIAKRCPRMIHLIDGRITTERTGH